MWLRRTPQWLMVAATCGFCAVSLRAASNPPPSASEFYVVSVGFSDAWPGWHRSVLLVKPDGNDIRVRYIRVAPVSVDCGEATKIGATDARLPNTSLDAVTGGVNFCAMDTPSLSRVIRTFPAPQRMSVFAGDNYTIVARCGSESRVIRLPGDWEVDMARLKRKWPGIAAFWSLEKLAGTRAFGLFPLADSVPPEMAARLHPASETILSDLQSGTYDAGLAPRSFKDDAAALRPLSDVPASVKLMNPDHLRFARYVTPRYPPLAKQARISGTVELDITSNPTTGETERVALVSGSPLLVQAAMDAARQWRFVPGPDNVLRAARVVIEFVFHCP